MEKCCEGVVEKCCEGVVKRRRDVLRRRDGKEGCEGVL